MRMERAISNLTLSVIGLLWTGAAVAEPLSADRAVQIALEHNSRVINANADVLQARSGVYSSYSGVMPHFTATYTRFGSSTDNASQSGLVRVGSALVPGTFTSDLERHGTTPAISGTWSVLDLSNLSGLSSARSGVKASKLQRTSTRNDVAFSTRQQFYAVVQAVRLTDVSANALRLARDDERRVRALFEVGSVSRSDVLQAQVRTAQSELDSLTAYQSVVAQRVALANQLGLAESQLGDVDTVLTVGSQSLDEPALFAEAQRARPDLMAAEASLSSARAALNGARFGRLPYVTLSGSMSFNTSSRSTETASDGLPSASTSGTDRAMSGSVALNWDVFDGFATDSRVASARAQLARAQDARDALRRGLQGEVHQAVLDYQQAEARTQVARRAFESAQENVKLTQQKYNVGSATTLELINAQVQLQRAESDQVAALAAIRVAEAQLNRVRGRSE
jgi:outer membrane protein